MNRRLDLFIISTVALWIAPLQADECPSALPETHSVKGRFFPSFGAEDFSLLAAFSSGPGEREDRSGGLTCVDRVTMTARLEFQIEGEEPVVWEKSFSWRNLRYSGAGIFQMQMDIPDDYSDLPLTAESYLLTVQQTSTSTPKTYEIYIVGGVGVLIGNPGEWIPGSQVFNEAYDGGILIGNPVQGLTSNQLPASEVAGAAGGCSVSLQRKGWFPVFLSILVTLTLSLLIAYRFSRSRGL